MNYARETDAATAQDEAFELADRIRALRNPPGGCPWCDGSLDGYDSIETGDGLTRAFELGHTIYRQNPERPRWTTPEPDALYTRCSCCDSCKQRGLHESEYTVVAPEEALEIGARTLCAPSDVV